MTGRRGPREDVQFFRPLAEFDRIPIPMLAVEHWSIRSGHVDIDCAI